MELFEWVGKKTNAGARRWLCVFENWRAWCCLSDLPDVVGRRLSGRGLMMIDVCRSAEEKN